MRGIEQIPWLYDAICAAAEPFGLRRWRDWLTRAEGRTLEVGCGTGRNLPRYAPDLPLVGCDPDRRLLQRARRRSPVARLAVARAEALPFRDGAFDTVVSGLVFCTVADPALGLTEVRRVLRRDGTLRMLEHVRAEGVLGRFQDAVQPAWTALAGGCHPNRRTEQMVESAGFRIHDTDRRATRTLRRFVAQPETPRLPPP